MYIVKLSYHEAGVGPPLVFLHGLGSSGRDWDFQLCEFRQDFRVIVPDLRGFGRSPIPQDGYDPRRFAADVAALLQDLQAAPAHVVGLSLGGCVALQMALEWPQLLQSLTLVNSGARLRGPFLHPLLRALRRLWAMQRSGLPAVAAIVAQGLFPEPHQAPLRRLAVQRMARGNDPLPYWQTFRALARWDARAELHKVQAPTLVVAGFWDAAVPLLLKHELAAGIPDAQLTILARSRHATPMDQPAAFNRVVRRFLYRVEQRSK